MTADELCSAVNDNVGSVLYGTDEVWGTESVVNNQWNTVTVCNLSGTLDIRDV